MATETKKEWLGQHPNDLKMKLDTTVPAYKPSSTSDGVERKSGKDVLSTSVTEKNIKAPEAPKK